MPESDTAAASTDSSAYREYILDVRIVERTTVEGDTRYRFEAPDHEGITFADPEMATLYADVYFDVNGFQEAGTGDRGVPPTVIQAGRDTLVAYFLTQEGVDVHWAASFYGEKPEKIERYVSRVRKRAQKIREGAREHGHA
ncbi:hypothetical protein AMS69_10875 [Haloarcula rubripromontorii]|uniref:Uncharacterized protein n=1 Tax=Haloarcula rubripromontorii TaxID=1705562 RepID=A0A0M9AJV7_9EURY|nr:hypothetical protein [Haloarcula rubripromontorii]KOX92948.1 hypothetical protein AMS69_10875 [Haloarcula rubripromontorii]